MGNERATCAASAGGFSLAIADELFDVPQAGLLAVRLHEAFSWAYAHFILEDQMPIL